jgi:hypothetical protein
MSDNLTLVHRSKIIWKLAISTEFPPQYIKQHDFSLKNEPPFCLHFLMNHHLCIKPLVTIADAKCPTFLVMHCFQLSDYISVYTVISMFTYLSLWYRTAVAHICCLIPHSKVFTKLDNFRFKYCSLSARIMSFFEWPYHFILNSEFAVLNRHYNASRFEAKNLLAFQPSTH